MSSSIGDDILSDDDNPDDPTRPKASTSSPLGNIQKEDTGDPQVEGELSTRSPPTGANLSENILNPTGATL